MKLNYLFNKYHRPVPDQITLSVSASNRFYPEERKSVWVSEVFNNENRCRCGNQEFGQEVVSHHCDGTIEYKLRCTQCGYIVRLIRHHEAFEATGGNPALAGNEADYADIVWRTDQA